MEALTESQPLSNIYHIATAADVVQKWPLHALVGFHKSHANFKRTVIYMYIRLKYLSQSSVPNNSKTMVHCA